MDAGNPVYSAKDGMLLSRDGSRLLRCPQGWEGSALTIPAGVTEIGSHAFYGCTGLTSVVIPEGVRRIGNNAFESCKRLAEIDLPESVTSIGEYAFAGCVRLTDITLPRGLREISSGMFDQCQKLAGITIPDGVTRIGDEAFCECSSLARVTFPEEPEEFEIGQGAFRFCGSLTSLTFPDGSSIGFYAFESCTGLTEVTFGGLCSYCESTFSDCRNLHQPGIFTGYPGNLPDPDDEEDPDDTPDPIVGMGSCPDGLFSLFDEMFGGASQDAPDDDPDDMADPDGFDKIPVDELDPFMEYLTTESEMVRPRKVGRKKGIKTRIRRTRRAGMGDKKFPAEGKRRAPGLASRARRKRF